MSGFHHVQLEHTFGLLKDSFHVDFPHVFLRHLQLIAFPAETFPCPHYLASCVSYHQLRTCLFQPAFQLLYRQILPFIQFQHQFPIVVDEMLSPIHKHDSTGHNNAFSFAPYHVC